MEFDTCYAGDISIEDLCKGSPNLKKLNLSKNCKVELRGFTDAAVHTIVTYCPQIEALSINSWTDITDISMKHLSQLCCLKEIDLSYCNNVTSAGLQILLRATHQTLEALVFAEFKGKIRNFTHFVDAALLHCIGTYCSNLTKLHIFIPVIMTSPSQEVSDATNADLVGMLRGCPLLEDFSLAYFPSAADIIVATLVLYCPHLKRIYLDSAACPDEYVPLLCQSFPNLQALQLSNCQLSDTGIESIATYCHKLQELTLYATRRTYTDAALCALFTTCVDLRLVNFGYQHTLSDRCVMTLVEHCPRLRSLTLIHNSNLTDLTLTSIAVYGKSLEHLSIWGIHKATKESLTHILTHCKQLCHVIIGHCNLITNGPDRLDSSRALVEGHCSYKTKLDII